MRITLIGPDWNNSTDGVICQGIERLLDEAFGQYQLHKIFLQDLITQTFFGPDQYPTDLIVVAGTPWLWDSFQSSMKYRNLLNFIKGHPEARTVFMGIGSCLSIYNSPTAVLERTAELQGMHDLFGAQHGRDPLVIVRDKAAYAALFRARIKSHFLPCPAYFAYGIQSPEWPVFGHPVMVVQDPRYSISKVDYVGDKMRMRRYTELYKRFYREFNPRVYVANGDDWTYAVKDIGVDTGVMEMLHGWQHTLDVMLRSGAVLSGRVHCAVPAASLGKPLKCIPIDTRAQVLTNWGVESATGPDDLETGFAFADVRWENYTGEYVKLLREVMR